MIRRVVGGCAALVGVALLVGCGLAMLSLTLSGALQSDEDRRLAFLAKQAEQARSDAFWDALQPWLIFAGRAVVVIALACVVALIVTWIGTRLDTHVQQRPQQRLVYPDEQTGLYPVAQDMLTTPEGYDLQRLALAGYHQAQIAAAQNPGVPTHYAPHQSFEYAYEGADALPTPPIITELPMPKLPGVPTFAALYAAGQVGAGQPLLLGYSAGQPLTGRLQDWRSGAIAGLPGVGKTTTQRFIAAQAALQGARLVILDPHADAEDPDQTLAGTLAPLAASFLCEPASDPRQMVQALALVKAVMDGRLHGEPAAWPVFIFVDEFTSLMGRSDLAGPLATLLEAIAQEGRKTQVQGVISGQIWTVNRAGGSALRDSLASTYVHRLRRNQAQILLPTEDAKRAEHLPTGAAVLWRADGTICDVVIPLTTGADIVQIGQRLSRPGAVPVPSTPGPGAVPSGVMDGIGTPVDAMDGTLDAYTARVIGLYRDGKKLKAIIEELHPEIDVASGGRPYRDKRDDLEELIQAELRRRG